MGDMRKDYLDERFTIVSKKDVTASGKRNPYRPGNEKMTKPSVLSLVAQNGILQRLQDTDGESVKGWAIRVFEEDDPVVSTSTEDTYSERPHYSEPAYGYHYIVVASPEQDESLAFMDSDQWSNILMVVQDRLRWLYTQKRVTYVAVHASYGDTAGSSNRIPHMHLITLPTIPPVIAAEAKMTSKILNEKGACPICQIIDIERNGPRMILKTGGFVAFCPWSPRYPYEFWIVPEKHTTSFAKITQKDLNGLATILRATLGGLSRSIDNVAYSMAFHLSPETKNTKQIHWHVEVYPLTEAWSGLERGYGIFVNSKSPEDAAKELGISCRKELAGMMGVT